jgi:hypothetical protein
MQRSFRNIFFLAGILALGSCADDLSKPKTMDIQLPVTDSSGQVKPAELKSNTGIYPKHFTDQLTIADLRNPDSTVILIIHAPKTDDQNMVCEDSSCTTYFSFAQDRYPAFSHEMALGGAIGNAGDLDDDGVCEIYFVPDWFTSAWTGLNIYSLKNGNWKHIATQDVRREDNIVEDSLSLAYDKRIIKHKGYFELVGNKIDDDGLERLAPEKFYFK